MAAAKHTPGPWVAETTNPSDNAAVFAVDEGGLEWPAPIADCVDFEGRRPVEEAQANARLIAAAPDMLSALRAMLGEWEKFTRYGSPIAKAANESVNAARAAIVKAEGGL